MSLKCNLAGLARNAASELRRLEKLDAALPEGEEPGVQHQPGLHAYELECLAQDIADVREGKEPRQAFDDFWCLPAVSGPANVGAPPLALLRALVASLPQCGLCSQPATKSYERGGKRWCDEHAPSDCPDYPRAESLRRALAALGMPGGEA